MHWNRRAHDRRLNKNMAYQYEITLSAHRKGFHLVTPEVLKALGKLPESGILHLFIQHTSAALAIGENADPTVREDLNRAFDRLAPEGPHYTHDAEGSDDMPAHIKSTLAGSSVSVPITHGKLNLGRWQGIYLCEFREEGGARSLIATVVT